MATHASCSNEPTNFREDCKCTHTHSVVYFKPVVDSDIMIPYLVRINGYHVPTVRVDTCGLEVLTPLMV